MRSRSLLLALVALALAANARTDQLDQSYAGGVGIQGSVEPNAVFARAQTFTVGISGTLSRVRLATAQGGLQPGIELTLDVRPTDEAGTPLLDPGSALGSLVVDATLFPSTQIDLWDFDFASQAIPVVAGQQLAIVARSNLAFDEEGSLGLAVELGGAYAAGEAWVGTSSWSLQDGGGVDWIFETWVEAPEPEGATLAALLALYALSRRRA